ncbi:MAG: hypothetical protein ACTS46_00470 [Candidatus Hodgkinia cicadicola]
MRRLKDSNSLTLTFRFRMRPNVIWLGQRRNLRLLTASHNQLANASSRKLSIRR